MSNGKKTFSSIQGIDGIAERNETKSGGGGQTPQGNSGDGGVMEPQYSPPESPKASRQVSPQRDISPTYSGYEGESPKNEQGKKLDFSDESDGLDFKHGDQKPSAEGLTKKEEKKIKVAEENKASVAKETKIAEDELEEGVLEKDDKETFETLKSKATKGANFVLKVYKLKTEDNCKVCPRKTEKAFGLFEKGVLLFAAKCDTAFCLLTACNPYFLGSGEQQVIGEWIDKKIKKKLGKFEKSGSREQAIHQCNEAIETVSAIESVKKDLMLCMAKGPDSTHKEFLGLLEREKVVAFQMGVANISAAAFKDLADLGVTKADIKCATCGKTENLEVTVIGEDTIVGKRAHVHCKNLSCLVENLEQNTNMTPSAKPKLVDRTALGREAIDETKAKAFHRLIYLGRELLKAQKDLEAWKNTDKRRLELSVAYLQRREENENLISNINLKELRELENSMLLKKINPRRAKEDLQALGKAIESGVNELDASISEDKNLAAGQGEISRFKTEIKLLEDNIEKLKLKVEEKTSQMTREIQHNAIGGVKTFQVLLETNAFEKIAKLTKSIFDFEAKRKEFISYKLDMEQSSEKMARFYEEILEIPRGERLPPHNFEAILNIEHEYDTSHLDKLREVINRCGLMQMQAKEVEKEAWNRWYKEGSEMRSKNHKDLVERAADIQEKNKELVADNNRLVSELGVKLNEAEENKRLMQVAKDGFEAKLLSAQEKITLLEGEVEHAKVEIRSFNDRFEAMQKKPGGKGEEWTEVVGRRGPGSGDGRGSNRASGGPNSDRQPPQFLNQTKTFSSSSSSSSSSQRDQQEGVGDSEKQVRRLQVEKDNRGRDEQRELREEDRDRFEQERFQSQAQQRGFDNPNYQFRGPEQGSFRNFDQSRAGSNERRQPILSEEQMREEFQHFLQARHAANYQDVPRDHRRDEGQFPNRNPAPYECHGWLRGDCKFGNSCKFQHTNRYDQENYGKNDVARDEKKQRRH